MDDFHAVFPRWKLKQPAIDLRLFNEWWSSCRWCWFSVLFCFISSQSFHVEETPQIKWKQVAGYGREKRIMLNYVRSKYCCEGLTRVEYIEINMQETWVKKRSWGGRKIIGSIGRKPRGKVKEEGVREEVSWRKAERLGSQWWRKRKRRVN